MVSTCVAVFFFSFVNQLVGIVFSPTLNMPTSIFTMLMTNYSEAFRREEAAEEAPTISIVSSLATYEKPPE